MAILETAGRLLMLHGLQGVTMAQIAKAADVSKLTVYNHFGSKGQLFQSVLRHECEKHIGQPLFGQLAGENPRAELSQIGRAFIDIFYSPGATALYRIAIAEGTKNQEVSQLYYEAAPRRVLDHFKSYLGRLELTGQFKFCDLEEAADLFFVLLLGDSHMRVLLGLQERPTESKLKSLMDRSVEIFIQRYAL